MLSISSMLTSAFQLADSTAAHAAAQSFSAGTQATTTAGVNLRQGPGTTYPVITVLPTGTVVNVLQQDEHNWYQVQVNGRTGWLFGDYVQLKTANNAVYRIDQYPTDPNFYEVTDGKLYHVLGTPENRTASYLVDIAPAAFKQGVVYVRNERHQFYQRDADGDKYIADYSPAYETLDLRLPAPISAADIDRFIQANRQNSPLAGTGHIFLEQQRKYGVNALYLAAHAIHESAYGLSRIAKDKNNLFGYKAYDSDPYGSAAYFETLQDCIEFEAYYVAANYLSHSGKWYGGSSSLRGMNVHYATDPYWAEKIAGIMQRMRAYNASDYNHAVPLPNTAAKPRGPVPPPISVFINGDKLAFDQQPITVNYRTMVPVRAIFEKLGAKVEWDQAAQTVRAEKGTDFITLKVGVNTATKNGVSIPLDVSPTMVNYRTLVPVRFVSEALGAKVDWDEAARTVNIVTN